MPSLSFAESGNLRSPRDVPDQPRRRRLDVASGGGFVSLKLVACRLVGMAHPNEDLSLADEVTGFVLSCGRGELDTFRDPVR